MSSTDEEYVEPLKSSLPPESYEVVQQSIDPPRASWESVNADTDSGSITPPPEPSVDYEKKSAQ